MKKNKIKCQDNDVEFSMIAFDCFVGFHNMKCCPPSNSFKLLGISLKCLEKQRDENKGDLYVYWKISCFEFLCCTFFIRTTFIRTASLRFDILKLVF